MKQRPLASPSSAARILAIVGACGSALLPAQTPPAPAAAAAPAHGAEVRHLAYDASGRWLVSMDETTAKTWSVEDGERIGFARIEGDITAMRTSPSEPLVAFLRRDETVELRTVPALKPVRSWPTGNQYGTGDLAFSHDGASLATCASMGVNWGVRFWDSGTGTLTREMKGGGCDRIAMSPDGQWIATARRNGSRPEIRVWRLSDLTLVRTWTPYPEGSYFSLAIAGHGGLLVAGWRAPTEPPIGRQKQEEYSFWRLPSGERELGADGPSGAETVATSADTEALLSADGASVRIWKIPSATDRLAFERPKLEFRAHESEILAIASSPDRSTFATAGADRAVRIWQLIDGSSVRELADSIPLPKSTAPAHVASADRATPPAGGPARAVPQDGLEITGRLVTANGEPVAQRNLKLPLAHPDERGGLFYAFAPDFYEATTGDDGRFRFSGVKSGERYALVDLSSGRPSPLKRGDGSVVLLEIADGAKKIDLGEIRLDPR